MEEPDEEPKIYPQEDSTKPLTESIQFDGPNQSRQSSAVSSCSTIRAPPRRKNKGKYRRQNGPTNHSGKENRPQEQYPKKSSRIFPTPSYSRYYEPVPPRFAMKENEFRMRTDFGVPHHHQQQPWVIIDELNLFTVKLTFLLEIPSRLSERWTSTTTSSRSISSSTSTSSTRRSNTTNHSC